MIEFLEDYGEAVEEFQEEQKKLENHLKKLKFTRKHR